jgi:hypothetical protein
MLLVSVFFLLYGFEHIHLLHVRSRRRANGYPKPIRTQKPMKTHKNPYVIMRRNGVLISVFSVYMKVEGIGGR